MNDPQSPIDAHLIEADTASSSWVAINLDFIDIYLNPAQFQQLRLKLEDLHNTKPLLQDAYLAMHHEPSAEELAENRPVPVAPPDWRFPSNTPPTADDTAAVASVQEAPAPAVAISDEEVWF